ncbi:MAG: ABC transporter substrate-binding protein [Bacteroidales bacterium]|nr:ABC transporter substrate-binding protein [Bacteroidales bacterium]
MVMRFVLVFAFLLLMLSCNESKKESRLAQGNKYSRNFEIKEIDDGYEINLCRSGKTLTLSRKAKDGSIQIPIKNAVCFSTTYTAFISQLGERETISGISGVGYLCDSVLQAKAKDGKIAEIGYDKQLDMEKIISLNPDVVFAYGVDNESVAGFDKLEKIGIHTIMVDDYLESVPLGRTEWIKFFACFYDKLPEATEYFDSVENRYNELKSREIAYSPRVLVSLPWKGTWWVPGGNSFFANFVRDAGGDYVFNNDSFESLPYTIEQVFATASDAEIWLHPNEMTTRSQILNVDSRLESFPPYTNARIYNNNKICSPSGGSDFWESGILHPDIVLEDLRSIFSDTDDTLTYYRRLY